MRKSLKHSFRVANILPFLKRGVSARLFTSSAASLNSIQPDLTKVRITFVEDDLEDGPRIVVDAAVGAKLVDVALENDVDIEAACGGELACSTCHCVFTDLKLYESLPPKQEEEEDMLDLAADLTDTSRLSCQLEVSPQYEGATILVPGQAL